MNCTSNNPAKIERNLNIAQDRLAGLNYHQIAANNGCSIATVSYVLNDKEIKEIVETGIRKQVSLIPLADQVLYDCLTDKDDKQYRFKAAETIYKNTGIAPSHASNTTIMNVLYQDNRTQISADIADLIRYQTDQQDAEEAEFEVID